MKYKKVVAVLLAVGCIGLVGTLGYFLGQTNQKEPDVKQVVAPVDETEDTKQESRKIAVVNLDEGTTVGGEIINYADRISKFPSTDFEYSSLEEARMGVETGKYGAYVTIPATFSQSVESLNGTPQASQIEYVINKSFSGKSQYELLYNVVSYAETLNDSLSYMYLNNILNEFHNAQDGASNVMSNDLRDKDAIDRIAASDLVALIEMPEIVREENKIEAPDFVSYTEKNSELAKNIDEQYLKCVEDIEKEIKGLSENGNTLANVLTEIASNVEEIDLTVDEEGNSIAEEANKKLEQSLKEYVSQAPDKGGIQTQLREIQNHLTEIKNGWVNANNQNNKKLEEQLTDTLASYLEELKSQVPMLVATEQPDGSYQVTFQQTGTEVPPSVTFSIVDVPGAQNNPKQDLLKEISSAIAQAEQLTEKIQIPVEIAESTPGAGDNYTINVEYDIPMSVASVLKNYDGRAQALGYNSASVFLSEYANGNVDVSVSNQKKIQCSSKDWSAFTDYIKRCLEQTDVDKYQMEDITDVLYDEKGNILVDKNGKELQGISYIEQENNYITDMIQGLENTKELNITDVQQLVKDEYIIPITKNANNAKQIFVQRNEEEKNSISSYNESLAGFAPVINPEFITENIAGLTENNTSLQKELTENSTASMEYVNKVCQSTEENIGNLQKTITDTKENSDQAVADGLSEAKNVKAETSRANQNILKDFSEKLPYTRLGSAEYTQAYQFIVKPVVTEDLSTDVKEVKEKGVRPVDSEIKEEKEGHIPWTLIYAGIGILVLLVLALIIKNILKEKKEQ